MPDTIYSTAIDVSLDTKMCQARVEATRDDAVDIYLWCDIYLAVCYSTRFVPIPSSGGGVRRPLAY